MSYSLSVIHLRNIILLSLFFMIGCRQAEMAPTEIAEQRATVRPTMTAIIRPSATPSPPPTNTPTPTLTPSPTPTPTATAVAITINNALPATTVNEPEPVGGAPCGLVDTFDFPIDPPLALNVSRGGQDFGVFRNRYGKYHAGEDWGAPSGRRNLGEPVYGIGNGRVMYAAPNGWGRDKGVVIIEHVFPDGDSILSFYGHLDPPSVVLRAGECVKRGDQVGNIGDPRTSPHLHFELRTHMPYQPGPGYWAEDPTTVGWIPPSHTIWQQRILTQPNVDWTRPFTRTSKPIGMLNEASTLLLADREVLNINLNEGSIQDSVLPEDDNLDLLLVPEQNNLYTMNQPGELTKWILDVDSDAFVAEWSLELGKRGRTTLHPAPNDGVIVAVQATLFHVDESGELLWQFELEERPSYWASSANQTIFTTETPPAVWRIGEDQLPEQVANVTGIPILNEDILQVYAQDAVYEVREDTAVSTYPLPNGFLRFGDARALPNGRLLVAHTDIFDQRLLAFDSDGALLWERSYADLFPNNVQLLIFNEQPYFVTSKTTGVTTIVDIYAVDMETAVLTHIFTGGTRTTFSRNYWITPTQNGFMLSLNESLIYLIIE